MMTACAQNLRNERGEGGGVFAVRRETGRSVKNGEDGCPNLRDCDGRKPRKFLFYTPDLGILRKMADGVRRRSFIWEIPVNTDLIGSESVLNVSRSEPLRLATKAHATARLNSSD
jgi:hypothetical protein